MIVRYENGEIKVIWSDEQKLLRWQDSELAANEASANLGLIPREAFTEISRILKANPIDLAWWKNRELEIDHDLAAFIDERLRFLPDELKIYFHQKMTSFDDEDPAFTRMIKDSVSVVKRYCSETEKILIKMALRYRYTVMAFRTHGQIGGLQTFGKRCLTWLQVVRTNVNNLERTEGNLQYSKMSGVCGNYGDMDPRIEKEALRILGLKPFYGSTQILPRELYTPTAQALCQIALTLSKIGIDIRLGARSNYPIYQEPFKKKQKGSSAMPHKRNTIKSEKVAGMGRISKGDFIAIMDDIETWEERAIEQSSVERVAWPDLFHEVLHSLETMNKVLNGLVVYPDNMLREVSESRGCYASNEAKELLKEITLSRGINAEDAYRIIQLAAFNVFDPGKDLLKIRNNSPDSLAGSDEVLKKFEWVQRLNPVSIKEIIPRGELRYSQDLDTATEDNIQEWNVILKEFFSEPNNQARWNQIFLPSYLLRNEAILYQEILGV